MDSAALLYEAGESSKRWYERARSIFPGGVNSPVRAFKSVSSTPFTVAEATGPYLFDVDGRRYVDYINSWGPLVLGHAHPRVVQALHEQARKGTSYGASSVPEVELAEKIIALMPNLEMLRFVNSGTEAGMSVLRLARAFTKREKVVKFRGCYHGHVDSLLVQAGSGVLTLGLPDSPGVVQGAAAGTLLADFNEIDSVRACFDQFSDEIAAIIVEPVMGNAGLILPKSGFLQDLRSLADGTNTLLIFDEVMTGFRVDLGGAQKHYGVKPDLTMLGKVIGGGLPVGAFGGRKEIMSLIAPEGAVYQAGTLSGNPLAMVAGKVTLEEWSRGDAFARTSECASVLVKEMLGMANESGIALQAQSLGTMFGFFFSEQPVHTFSEAQRSDKERFIKFFKGMLKEGVFFAPSAFEAGFVSLAHCGDALDYTCEALRRVIPTLAF
jgi:glutamate-1-semialdehyde 2,1-aminomutase